MYYCRSTCVFICVKNWKTLVCLWRAAWIRNSHDRSGSGYLIIFFGSGRRFIFKSRSVSNPKYPSYLAWTNIGPYYLVHNAFLLGTINFFSYQEQIRRHVTLDPRTTEFFAELFQHIQSGYYLLCFAASVLSFFIFLYWSLLFICFVHHNYTVTSGFWPRVRARALRAPVFLGSLPRPSGRCAPPRPSHLRCFLFIPPKL